MLLAPVKHIPSCLPPSFAISTADIWNDLSFGDTMVLVWLQNKATILILVPLSHYQYYGNERISNKGSMASSADSCVYFGF
jgi:hypothetical protein